MLLTLMVGTLVYLAIDLPMVALALWIMVFYLALLAWETKTAMGFIKAYYNDTSADNQPTMDKKPASET